MILCCEKKCPFLLFNMRLIFPSRPTQTKASVSLDACSVASQTFLYICFFLVLLLISVTANVKSFDPNILHFHICLFVSPPECDGPQINLKQKLFGPHFN